MSKAKEYEISTIKDIFEKVPLDRIDCCFDELKVLVKQAKGIDSLLGLAVEGLCVAKTEFPLSVTWIDDGLGDVEMKYTCLGDELFTHKVKCS